MPKNLLDIKNWIGDSIDLLNHL